ncbi:carboxylesterase/lipase family protein [Nocardia sp. CA-128927]|uniref:carboxylesterase/lipase family protein n=1 Tax=Nocardia sp. CA-128927 TaxID=3239975 RepID=UPI003D9617DF
MLVATAVIALLAGSLSGCGVNKAQPSESDNAVVATASGSVRGVVTTDKRQFSGIPYAAAPVGDLRWKLPMPPQAWSQVRDATNIGADCLQPATSGPAGTLSGSEDCLYLNVTTPRGPADRQRPVLVWIHGGGFQTGSGSWFDPSKLVAAGDMIAVSINYRLGAPGFLAHPGLAQPDGQVGNFGLLDQQAALRWVRDNIAAFGGDPTKVTIAGESAGAMSVCDHLASPASEGLFRGAILESGPCELQADRTTAVTRSEEYANTVGCPGGDATAVAQCLRGLPADRLMTTPLEYAGPAGSRVPGPVTGQPLLPEPTSGFRAGKAAKVPVLIGTNHDEFTFFAVSGPLAQHPMTGEQYSQQLAQIFGPNAEAIAARYPLTNYDQPVLAFSAAMTDYAIVCPNADMSTSLSRSAPVYAYEFADPNAAPFKGMPAPPPFPLGAAHAFELPYLFDTNFGTPPASPAQQKLSDQMIHYWAAFVRTGDPNTPGQPTWPQHNNNTALILKPGTLTTGNVAAEHNCDLRATIASQ